MSSISKKIQYGKHPLRNFKLFWEDIELKDERGYMLGKLELTQWQFDAFSTMLERFDLRIEVIDGKYFIFHENGTLMHENFQFNKFWSAGDLHAHLTRLQISVQIRNNFDYLD